MTDDLDRLLRLDQVKGIVPMATSTLYKMMATGRFPKPVKLGDMSLWSSREIAQWQEQRKAERG